MTKQHVLDLCFLDVRHKLVGIAAFLDRADHATGPADFRLENFRAALEMKRRSHLPATRLLFQLKRRRFAGGGIR